MAISRNEWHNFSVSGYLKQLRNPKNKTFRESFHHNIQAIQVRMFSILKFAIRDLKVLSENCKKR